LCEGRDAIGEVAEAVGHLTGRAALVDVVIPLRALGERDLEPDLGLG
jgi:hypothetical protein